MKNIENTTKATEEQRTFFFRKGYDDAQEYTIKYGMREAINILADYIKVVNVQDSWDEYEFAIIEGMLTYIEAQKIPQEA